MCNIIRNDMESPPPLARSINTPAINMDINPGLWLADEQLQRLGGPVLAYVNLMAYATTLSATTGSEYVNGDFDMQLALLKVRHLDDELDALVGAGLVVQVDGARWHVGLWQTTSHDDLQAAADRHEQRNATKTATRAARDAEEEAAREKAERKRAQDADRQRKKRERDRMAVEPPAPIDREPTDDGIDDADRRWLDEQTDQWLDQDADETDHYGPRKCKRCHGFTTYATDENGHCHDCASDRENANA